MDDQPISELTLSRVWQDGQYVREMRTVDGRRLAVVYGGVWTHQNGPDFRDAMIEVDGRLLRGAVELHLRASDWNRHGHQHDPAYDDVVVHLVRDNDIPVDVCGPSGSPIATVLLPDYLRSPLADLARQTFVTALGSLGTRPCLPTLAGGRADAIRNVLRRAGWQRMNAKQLRFTQDLERLPAGEVLYRGLLDGMGLMHNRNPMAEIGERLPLSTLESLSPACDLGVSALLVGVGGFLPLSPGHAALADIDGPDVDRLEARFAELSVVAQIEPLLSTAWSLNRVRPLNHPVRRLASLGDLIQRAGPVGLLASFMALPLDGGRAWRGWLDEARPSIGRGRVDQLAVNVLASFVSAYADAVRDDQLAERAGLLWESLPGKADDSVARTTLTQIVGQQRFPIKLAIESQGLHEIGRNGCRQLRCFECPIAALAVMHEDGDAGGFASAE